MITKETIGKKWIHPTTGEVRYYVNDAYVYGGLDVVRYKSGNICDASYNGEDISNCEAKRMIGSVYKCWITEDGEVHIKASEWSRDYSAFHQAIKDNIKAKLSE